MKKMVLFIALAMMSVFANAASLEFKFDINSSGPSIYPCDAGLQHKAHPQRVCYDRVSMDSCNPSLCTDEVQCNCVCTADSDSDAGEYRHDFMSVSYANWTDNGEQATNIQSKGVAAGKTSFNRMFSNKDEWNKQLTKLSFNLGSERYGAEFYLDVCYRGPQIDYYAAGSFSDTPNFQLKAQATVTDIISSNGLRYSQLADLEVKAISACDQQGMGSYVYAGDGAGNFDNALLHDITSNVTVPNGQFQYSTNFSAFNTGANLFLINKWINVNNSFSPRFCKIRYTFKEARRDSSDLVSQIRKWKHQKAQVCTYTSINEDL